ncbi:MAG: RecQ family ATP-dependent DNA helicase [Chitinophagaceae bacterium]|nr:RecQ family ATP-dependent DNA helicase [Chitinophagaceae bacterium]
MLTIHQILKQYWGFDSFRPLQEDVIRSVLSGHDTLALMPTGGGKSLCFQVPAMCQEGMCLVISPLIALMKDQVENLRRKNITAYSIFSGMSRKEVIHTLETVTNSNCKFLYVSPERLETALFKEYLPGMNITLIAVDEAHCISQWGYDFRPPYLRIAKLREELPDVPVLALTASATAEVQQDICDKLHFNKSIVFRQSFERANLSYSVFKVDSRINKIIEILKNVPGTGIVYCKSRKRTKEISELLQLQGIAANYYHAGLLQEERNSRQEAWINNKVRVIVCTNAFGMGIDKPDVRTVIHADAPDCLENYYQEAGRAGRDGKTAYAVLLYDERELQELHEMTAIRFPSQNDIRNVYHAVANYLQIPSGTGVGEYYDFDLPDFLRKFKMNTHTVVYSLKALEQEGWLSFNEQVFLPSTVQFTATKDHLYQFEKDNPVLEPVIKSLLRAYGGIFDHACTISELQVAQLARKEAEKVKKQLLQLHAARIIDYTPRKDSPQLLLLRNRVKAEELTVNVTAYHKRKEIFQQRVGEIVRYAKEEAECRSRMIGVYFGDKDIRSCGICDNCLRRKAVTLTREEFENIHSRIAGILITERLPVKELMQRLNGIKKEKAWKVIEFLQAENKIEMDTKGILLLK